VTFLSRLSWFVAILMLYGVAKLLFDNILYAAIMRWLSAHGIEESDMVAVVTANLIPIAGAIALPAAIYWLSMQHHATKAKPVPAAEPPKAEIRPSFFRRLVARLITWDDPLPIIASSLVVAFVVGIVWQVNFGPLTHLRKPVPSTPTEIVLSPAEMLAARTAVKQISVSFLFVRPGIR
jgi:hypothetical protein